VAALTLPDLATSLGTVVAVLHVERAPAVVVRLEHIAGTPPVGERQLVLVHDTLTVPGGRTTALYATPYLPGQPWVDGWQFGGAHLPGWVPLHDRRPWVPTRT
jgi:hypothetical protein